MEPADQIEVAGGGREDLVAAGTSGGGLRGNLEGVRVAPLHELLELSGVLLGEGRRSPHDEVSSGIDDIRDGDQYRRRARGGVGPEGVLGVGGHGVRLLPERRRVGNDPVKPVVEQVRDEGCGERRAAEERIGPTVVRQPRRPTLGGLPTGGPVGGLVARKGEVVTQDQRVGGVGAGRRREFSVTVEPGGVRLRGDVREQRPVRVGRLEQGRVGILVDLPVHHLEDGQVLEERRVGVVQPVPIGEAAEDGSERGLREGCVVAHHCVPQARCRVVGVSDVGVGDEQPGQCMLVEWAVGSTVEDDLVGLGVEVRQGQPAGALPVGVGHGYPRFGREVELRRGRESVGGQRRECRLRRSGGHESALGLAGLARNPSVGWSSQRSDMDRSSTVRPASSGWSAHPTGAS